jgi:hypothetical protein
MIMLYDYSIPGDCKELRRSIFTELMTPDTKTGYMDGEDYQLMRPYAKERALDLESCLWLAFLYGISYSCTTTMRFLEEFPTIADVTPKRVNAFWKDKKESLWFNPDKKYLKNNDQVIPAIRSICELSHKNLSDYLCPLLEQGFDVTYKEITKRWRFFGPHGAYLFFDALYGMQPSWYSDPEHLDWKNCGQTVVEGMAHLLCDDEAIQTKQYNLERYNRMLDKLANRFHKPKIVLESNLCFFRKLFKGSRYLGYYADRNLMECHATADILREDCGIDVWKLRKKTTQDDLRGEIHGWDAIRKERLKLFLTTGALS